MAEPGTVRVQGVCKDFVLPHERHTSLKQAAVNALRRSPMGRFRVLSDVTFAVEPGEFFGIVGRNGSGKSTLLKILADIYVPTSGKVAVYGRVAPFVELGVGFNPELSGRDNVFLNGAIFGLTRQELLTRYDDIVAFAELAPFMEQKLKNYSTGMQVRLAFSIAIQADAEIIIMDEVLAVGDAAFQEKCFDSFRRLKTEGRTIILVTHDMGNVEKFCDRVLVLDRGVTYGVMDPGAASAAYNTLNFGQPAEGRAGGGDVTVAAVQLVTDAGVPMERLRSGEPARVQVKLKRPEGPPQPFVCDVSLLHDGVLVGRVSTEGERHLHVADALTLHTGPLPLVPGAYTLTVGVRAADDEQRPHPRDLGAYSITIDVESTDNGSPASGLLDLRPSWGTP